MGSCSTCLTKKTKACRMHENLREGNPNMTVELRDYQDRIVTRLLKHYEEDQLTSFMITSPTGSGKTVMGLHLAKTLHERFGWRTNWVANRRKLLSQVIDMQTTHFPSEVEKGYLTPVSMFDKHPPHADILMVDEGHHDACASAALVHARTEPKLVIGYSATPQRTDKMKLAFSKTIQDAGIHRLIREGWLSRYIHWVIPEHTPESVAKFYLQDPLQWGKTAVYFLSIQDCYAFQELLLRQGIVCNVVSSRHSEEERETRIAEFESGHVNVVANVQVLAQGYDFPGLRTVFIRDSSRLPAVQMGGRVLRLHETKIGGANIVQSVKTHWPFTRTANAINTFLWMNDDWKSLTGRTEKVETACQKTAKAFAISKPVALPKWILAQQKNRKIRVWRRNQGRG